MRTLRRITYFACTQLYTQVTGGETRCRKSPPPEMRSSFLRHFYLLVPSFFFRTSLLVCILLFIYPFSYGYIFLSASLPDNKQFCDLFSTIYEYSGDDTFRKNGSATRHDENDKRTANKTLIAHAHFVPRFRFSHTHTQVLSLFFRYSLFFFLVNDYFEYTRSIPNSSINAERISQTGRRSFANH